MFDQLVQEYVEMGAFSGVVLVEYNQELIYKQAFGYANQSHQVPNRITTRFHIASVSKPFTAVAIMQLVEQDLLSLSTLLQEFAPNIANADKITIEHLLTHHSGLPNVNSHPRYTEFMRMGISLQELVKIFETFTPDFPPGDRYQYSNTNYNLLAFIIEILSGTTYGEYLENNIFTPVGMSQTLDHHDPQEIIIDLAEGYTPRDERDLKLSPYLDWSVKTGNGSLVSTAGDLLKFAHALDDATIISKDSFDQMVDKNYGLFTSTLGGMELFFINGRSPGYTARFTEFPQPDCTIIVLSNNYTASVVDEITKRIAMKIFDITVPYTVLPLKQHLEHNLLLQRQGTYQFGDDYFVPNLEFEIRIQNDCWVFDSKSSSTTLIPTGASRFFIRLYWSTGGFEQDSLYFEFSGTKYYAQKLPT